MKTSISLDNIQFDRKNLMKNFLDIKKITNIEIVKCYKIIFYTNNIKYNYGLFFFFFMFILYFTCLTVFYCKSLKKLIDEIIKIIEAKNKENDVNKNYIKNNKIDKIYSRKNKNKNNKRSKKIKIEKKLMEYDSTFKKLDKYSNITIMKNKIKNKIAKDAKLNENNYMKKH